MTFNTLGLSSTTLKSIAEEGYNTPTPIQEQVIPLVLNNNDIFGIAQTGTGKTASYCLPLIDKLSQSRARARLPRALILAPTRELAIQIREALETYGRYSQLKLIVIIGGESPIEQERSLNKGVDVIIATPGRLLDTLNRGKVMLNAVEMLVVDEADRMMDMGFIPDIEKIFSYMLKHHQTLLFSATSSEPIRKLTAKFLKNPIEISITPSSQTAETIEQIQVQVTNKQKREALRHLIAMDNVQQALIFCNRKRDVSLLCNSLKRYNFKAGMIHGDMTQGARSETLEHFKNGEIMFLVASDIAARGLDITDLPYVFNFDVPINAEEYVHRIGRTGRAGRSGKAFTLVCEEDLRRLSQVEKLIDQKITMMTLPESFKFPEPKSKGHVKNIKVDDSTALATENLPKNKQNDRQQSRRRQSTKNVPHHGESLLALDENLESSKPIDIEVSQALPISPRHQNHRVQQRPVRSNQKTAKIVTGFGNEIPAFFNLSWPGLITAETAQTTGLQ